MVMLETLAGSANLHQKKEQGTCRPRFHAYVPRSENCPLARQGVPKADRWHPPKAPGAQGNPLNTASWSFFRLAGNLQPNYNVSRYSLPMSDRCRLTGFETDPRGDRVSKKRETESFLPLTAAMFHILLALADGEKHGYAILKEVARRTEDKVRLSAGTLYGNLSRLASSGLIAESEVRPDLVLDDERRRYYLLTEFGREVAVAEAERMEEALGQAHAKKLFRKPKLA
jgi:DNA-binding PadR family transcriptional regulator